ncbi:hypothetical protein PFISCL1PPCAC_2476, partial [Pristionchus fissidentatus]
RCSRKIDDLLELKPFIFMAKGKLELHDFAWLCPKSEKCCEWECCEQEKNYGLKCFFFLFILIVVIIMCWFVRYTAGIVIVDDPPPPYSHK